MVNMKVFSKTNSWVLWSAILLGVGIVLYLVFFCPEECH